MCNDSNVRELNVVQLLLTSELARDGYLRTTVCPYRVWSSFRDLRAVKKIVVKSPVELKGIKWAEPGSNRRPSDFQSLALPTELSALFAWLFLLLRDIVL